MSAKFLSEVMGQVEVLGGDPLAGAALCPSALIFLAPWSLSPIRLGEVLGRDGVRAGERAGHLLPTEAVPQEAAFAPEFEDAGFATQQVLQQGRARARRSDDEDGALQALECVSHLGPVARGIEI